VSPDDLRAYVAASRAGQGLPPTVTDAATLERVAAVFRLTAPDELAPPKPRKHRKPPPGRPFPRSDSGDTAA
jgi:hypothetical protein